MSKNLSGRIMDIHQNTVKRPIRFVGIGLHSGRTVTMDILPAPANSGILFGRTDLNDAPSIKADASQISRTDLSTTIGSGRNTVSTIEHLMAAFAGLGIDNAHVMIDAPEVPIMDGSAAPFVDKLLGVGTVRVDGNRKLLLVNTAFEVRDGDRLMRVEPSTRLEFNCDIEYASAAIGHQSLTFALTRSSFLELAEARTFCHADEVDAMRAVGLARGGSLDNAVVVSNTAVMNVEGLRMQDEFVRHKLLDCIGDLALLGSPLIGRITLVKNGHALHARFMKELLASQGVYSTVEIGMTTDGAQGAATVQMDPCHQRQAAMSDGVQALAAAAALYG